MDLSKAFGTINHDLLIERVNINRTFSSWTQLFQGVPQGSVFGRTLFNIYNNDIFFALKRVDIFKDKYL